MDREEFNLWIPILMSILAMGLSCFNIGYNMGKNKEKCYTDGCLMTESDIKEIEELNQ